MARLRYNGLATTLAADLAAADTTITFAAPLAHSGGTAVPTISGSDYIPLAILDAAGALQEIVNLTAYASGAATGTITRAQEDTAAAAHTSGATIVHAPTTADFTASSGRTLIASRTLASAAASIDFTSSDVPASGYNHLELVLLARSTKAASGDTVYIAVNGDTTAANYKLQRFYGASAAAGADTTADRRLGFVDAASDPAGAVGLIMVAIPDFLGSWQKMIQPRGGKTGDPLIELAMVRWLNTAAITSLTLTCAGGSFAAGSKAWLYGLQ